MQVLFRHNAFIGGMRFRRAQSRHDWTDFPDALEDQLPTTARVMNDGKLVTMEDLRGDRANTLAGMRSKDKTMAEAIEGQRDTELDAAFQDDKASTASPNAKDDLEAAAVNTEEPKPAKPAVKKAGKKKASKKK